MMKAWMSLIHSPSEGGLSEKRRCVLMMCTLVTHFSHALRQ